METANIPQCWADVEDVIDAGLTKLILFGPPGTGKTYAGLNMFGARNAHRLICNEDMTSADVTGHFMPTEDGTYKWNEGAVIRAWRGDGHQGGRVVADEIDRASGDVLSVLLSMFDSVESSSWAHPVTGEVVRPNPGFSVFMTTNIEDMEDLPTALKDRFPVAIRINKPHPSALTFLSEDLRIPAANSVDAYGSERISLRGWKAFDQMRGKLGDEKAARLCFGDNYRSVVDAIKVNQVSDI
jgi:MoxR-like ATPase